MFLSLPARDESLSGFDLCFLAAAARIPHSMGHRFRTLRRFSCPARSAEPLPPAFRPALPLVALRAQARKYTNNFPNDQLIGLFLVAYRIFAHSRVPNLRIRTMSATHVANICPHEFPTSAPLSGRHTVIAGSTPILRSSQQNETRRLFPLRAHSGFLAARACEASDERGKSASKYLAFQEVPPPGSYRLRRHFPRPCNSPTQARHPYRVRFFPDGQFPIHHSPFGIMNPEPHLLQAATPSKSDSPPPKRRQESAIPNSGSRIAPPFPPTGHRVPPRTPVPGFIRPLGERFTSLPWSRPGSDPWRPSRGTGYG